LPLSTKSVITKPQNVMVLRDVMCSGYVAGGNTRFFGEEASKKGGYTRDNIRQAMTDRLSFTDDASGEYESMLAFAVPLDSGSKRDQVFSISSRLLPWEVTSGQKHEYFPGGQDHHTYYSAEYGLNTVHFGEDIRAAENMEFISNVRHVLSRTHALSQPTVTHPSPNPLRPVATSAGLRQQLALLRGPAPRVLAVVVHVLRAFAWAGPLWPRRHPRRRMLLSCISTSAPQSPHPHPAFTSPPLTPRLSFPQARWRRGESVSLESARNAMVSLEAAAHSQLVFQKRS